MSRAVEIFQKIFAVGLRGKRGVGLSIEGVDMRGDFRKKCANVEGWNLRNPLGPQTCSALKPAKPVEPACINILYSLLGGALPSTSKGPAPAAGRAICNHLSLTITSCPYQSLTIISCHQLPSTVSMCHQL